MLEAKVENYLKHRVEQHGGEVRKVAWVGRRHAPDRLVMLNRKSRFVELKRPGEVARAGQEREHLRMRELGGMPVWTIDSQEKVDLFIKSMMAPDRHLQ